MRTDNWILSRHPQPEFHFLSLFLFIAGLCVCVWWKLHPRVSATIEFGRQQPPLEDRNTCVVVVEWLGFSIISLGVIRIPKKSVQLANRCRDGERIKRETLEN
jgi:hypothetical protein